MIVNNVKVQRLATTLINDYIYIYVDDKRLTLAESKELAISEGYKDLIHMIRSLGDEFEGYLISNTKQPDLPT